MISASAQTISARKAYNETETTFFTTGYEQADPTEFLQRLRKQRVEFVVKQGQKGPQASQIRPL